MAKGNKGENNTPDQGARPDYRNRRGFTERATRFLNLFTRAEKKRKTPFAAIIAAAGAFALTTACASDTEAPKPAAVALESLSNQIKQTFESRGISGEAVDFATNAYAGPDSTGPQLVKNTDIFYAFSQEPPQNWQALWISQLSSGNPDVVKAVVDEFNITPKALEDYIEQATNILDGMAQENGGILPDYEYLSPEQSLANNVNSATTLHFVALLESLKRVLSLAQNGDVTLPTESTLEDTSGEFNYTTVTINGKTQDSPINIQMTPKGELLVGKNITTELSYFNWQTGENLAGLYSLTAVNAPNENGALILTGNIQSADR